MSHMKKIPKKNHFLPQGIQKQFATRENNNQIFFMDKSLDKKAVPVNIGDAGHINNFYKYPNGIKSLEIDFFGEIDNDTPPVIKRIINSDSVEPTIEERKKLIKYVAAQICRVPSKKEGLNDLRNCLMDNLNINITSDLKADYLDLIVKNTKRHAIFLENKEVIIHRITNKNNFIISDNPVLTINISNSYTIILDVPSVTEYDLYMMPLSPKHIIVFFKPEVRNYIWDYIKKSNHLQIERANKYIYSNQKTILEAELKKYYKNTYDLLSNIDPFGLQQSGFKRGDVINLPKIQIKLDDKLKEKLITDEITTYHSMKML